MDTIDPFFTTQGDIRATKSDSKSDSNNDPVVDDEEKDPVVDEVNVDLIFSPGHMTDVDRSLKDPDDSDSMKEIDSNPDPVVVETVVDDSELESTPDPVLVELEVGPAVVGNKVKYNPKPNGQEYRSKPKSKKKKRNQRLWNNNKKKIRWKDQPHTHSFPDH